MYFNDPAPRCPDTPLSVEDLGSPLSRAPLRVHSPVPPPRKNAVGMPSPLIAGSLEDPRRAGTSTQQRAAAPGVLAEEQENPRAAQRRPTGQMLGEAPAAPDALLAEEALWPNVLQGPYVTDPPQEFCCPITSDIMDDPVVCEDGHSYEREAIARWLTTSTTSPMTRETLRSGELTPNFCLRNLIRDWKARYRMNTGTATLGAPRPSSAAAPVARERVPAVPRYAMHDPLPGRRTRSRHQTGSREPGYLTTLPEGRQGQPQCVMLCASPACNKIYQCRDSKAHRFCCGPCEGPGPRGHSRRCRDLDHPASGALRNHNFATRCYEADIDPYACLARCLRDLPAKDAGVRIRA